MANISNWKFEFHPGSSPIAEYFTGYIEPAAAAGTSVPSKDEFLALCQGKVTGRLCPFLDLQSGQHPHCRGFEDNGLGKLPTADVFQYRINRLNEDASCRPTLAKG